MHRANGVREVTLSPLCDGASLSPLSDETVQPLMPLPAGRLAAGQPVALRVTFADDDRARQFCEALAAKPIPRLGASPCRLARLPHWHSSDPDCLHASWAQLADAPSARRLHLRFETPTFFSHQGEMRLLPEPVRLWEGWRRAWETLAPASALPLGADTLDLDGLQITRYQLSTEAISLKGGLYRGFVGEMALEWRASTPPETRRTAAALAGIADFFGTGAKTMLGLGQTRVTMEE